ncbi:UNVERIFIED_CONTAM: hypothetical protein Sradi_3665000 [Sesamum radiatum]|uniref:CID domain-containing protein n=1 Tax=Sesamum radiatum TaxID=300843 RepID=A0AAW2QJC4_SESRA
MLHHKRADQIIVTWDKHLRCPEILPSALKEVIQNGKDDERNAVFKLIHIWEREKVFGSLSQSLEDILLGDGSPPPLDLRRKCSHSVTITKRDEQSIRTKLSIGGLAEKIVSAFELVLHDHANEDKEMRKCKSEVHRVEKLEKDVDKALNKGKDSLQRTVTKRLKDEEENLEKSIEKSRSFEANRAALVFQLQDALREQEIMTSVLAKSVADQAKGTSLMTSSLCNDPMSKSKSLLMSAHTYPSWSSPNQPQPTIHQVSSAQAQNQSIPNPAPLQYVKPSAEFVSFHDYGIYRPSLPGPPPSAPPSYMVSLLGRRPTNRCQLPCSTDSQ